MSSTINAAEQFMDMICAPLGDYAPKKRRIGIDFKGPQGEDRHLYTFVYCDRRMTDKMVVQAIRDQLISESSKLSAICEVMDDGAGRCLYCAPGFLEESMRDSGVPIPADIKAKSEEAGFHPVNWDELVRGWEAAP